DFAERFVGLRGREQARSGAALEIEGQHLREVDQPFRGRGAEAWLALRVVAGEVTVGRTLIEVVYLALLLDLAGRHLPSLQPAEDRTGLAPTMKSLPQHPLDGVQMRLLRAEQPIRLGQLPGVFHRLV